jgi:hypothetical protein
MRRVGNIENLNAIARPGHKEVAANYLHRQRGGVIGCPECGHGERDHPKK